jgi:hypothetical protein
MRVRPTRPGATSSTSAVILGWTIVGIVALLTTFLLIGGLFGPPSHVSNARTAITAGVLAAQLLVGLALVRRWPHSRPIAIAVSLVGAAALATAALRMFTDPGPPGPEGGPYQAAFGLTLVAVFQLSAAAILIRK